MTSRNLAPCATCGSETVERNYRTVQGFNSYRRVFRCKESISHNYTDKELHDMGIDIEFYKSHAEPVA